MIGLMDSIDWGTMVSHYSFSTRILFLAQGPMGHELMVTLTLQKLKFLLLDIFPIWTISHCQQ